MRLRASCFVLLLGRRCSPLSTRLRMASSAPTAQEFATAAREAALALAQRDDARALLL